jgi:hypothetical protein
LLDISDTPLQSFASKKMQSPASYKKMFLKHRKKRLEQRALCFPPDQLASSSLYLKGLSYLMKTVVLDESTRLVSVASV